MKEKAKKILIDFFNKDTFNDYVSLNIMLLVLMVVVRLFSFLEFYFRLGIEANVIGHISTGIIYDLSLLCHIIALGLIPFIILHKFIPRITKGLYIAFSMLYVIISALLIEYFCNMSKPLDHIIYMYSSEEISNIIFSSVDITVAPILFFVSIIAVSVTICILWKKVKINHIVSLPVCTIAIIVSLTLNYKDFILSENLYKSHIDFCYATNQISYSYIKIADYENDQSLCIDTEDIKEAAKVYQLQFPQNTYLNYEYPYNHYFNDKDVIGNFLNKPSDGNPPNFVFIIIEGFGRKLTGVDNPSVSFTPFLDSLAATGLMWENCLSTAERTFEVLPSVFASAPYGTHGFANRYYPIPYHNSLLQDMSRNGYTISFFYGGSSSFDGQNEFMEANNASFIMKAELDTASEKYHAMKNGNRWGLDDDEMFGNAIQHKQKENKRPFVDIYLTLTTHEPFICPDQEKYEMSVEKIAKNSNITDKRERKNIEENKNIFACFNYTDNCIRELITEYKKLNAYDNTIFVICGDHRMCPLGSINQLQKYHIPLIIHSNLVKSPRKMKAVVSHLDIAPTINAYLSENFEAYSIEKECQWLGTSLDTATNFRCNKIMPFILNSRDIEEYLYDTLFITYDRLFSVHDNLTVTPLEDDHLLQMMKDRLEAEKAISKYAVYYNCLKPISNSNDEPIYNFASNFEKRNPLEETIVDDNGNKVVHLGKDNEFGSLCRSFELNDNYKNLNVSVKFNFKNLSKGIEMPLFVMSIEKDGNFLFYKTRKLLHEKDVEKDGWMIFNNRENIYIKDDCKDCTMKIYLWNCEKGEIMYDNISVSIFNAK